MTSLVGENGSICIRAIAVQVKDDFLHWVLRLEQTPKRTTLFVSQLQPRSNAAETLEASHMFLVRNESGTARLFHAALFSPNNGQHCVPLPVAVVGDQCR